MSNVSYVVPAEVYDFCSNVSFEVLLSMFIPVHFKANLKLNHRHTFLLDN